MTRGKGTRRAGTHVGKSDERYVGRGELREIFPVSDMTVWRWMRNPRVGFPKPVKLGADGRNYWWLPTLREWQDSRKAEKAA
jgi:predicted DNA-binding transcriptional regulator AlpA